MYGVIFRLGIVEFSGIRKMLEKCWEWGEVGVRMGKKTVVI